MSTDLSSEARTKSMTRDFDGDHVTSEDSQKDAKSDAEVMLLNRFVNKLCNVADADDAAQSFELL